MTDNKQYPELPEPDSYVFQHEETGQSQFIDRQQVEWGFEKNNPRLHRVGEAFTAAQMRAYVDADRAMRAAQAAPAIVAGDAVFAFASMLTTLPYVVPFGSCAWATPGAELASAFNAANGLNVSRDFPTGLVFPKIEGDLLACIEKASQQNTVVAPTAKAAPASQDAEDAI